MFEEEKELNLEILDFSCTEVWLDVKPNGKITIHRDGEKIATIKRDTVLYDSGLQPNTTYEYTADDETVGATTLDTTSHDYSWETYTFGDYSSVLRDVAIVDEDNIWSVGEIYFNDSTGQPDPKVHSSINWNGNSWILIRILTKGCGGVIYPPGNTVYIMETNNILFGHIDGSITHYDGINFNNDCSLIEQLNGSLKKIWGSKNDFYVISGSGFFAHSDGQNWYKIETNTETRLLDIYGENNNVFTGGWNDFHKAVLFHYKDGNLRTVINEFPSSYDSNKISGPVRSLW